MQFAVPQFTEVEDRLIGSLTLKQFLVLLATGGIILFFWTMLGPSFLFFILSLPFAIVGVASALGKYNGRPMFTYLLPFAAFLTSNRVMVFKREPAVISVSKTEVKKPSVETLKPQDLEPAESRLKKLAYMLDRKTEEEKRILDEDDRNIIQATSLPKVNMQTVTSAVSKAKADILATARKLDAQVASPMKAKSSPVRSSVATAQRPLPKTRATKKSAPTQPEKAKKFDPSSFLQI